MLLPVSMIKLKLREGVPSPMVTKQYLQDWEGTLGPNSCRSHATLKTLSERRLHPPVPSRV